MLYGVVAAAVRPPSPPHTLSPSPHPLPMDREKLQDAISGNRNFTATRKASLYSNFARLEDSNPDGYEANIIAWREVLETALKDGAFADKTCIEAGPELIKDLNDSHNGVPLSLDRVFDAMVADHSLMPLSEFVSAYSSSPQPRSLLSIPFRVFGWAANRVFHRTWASIDAAHGTLKHEKYVSMPAVQTHAARIVGRLIGAAEERGNSQPAQVFTFGQVRELVDPTFSELDIQCGLSLANATKQVQYDASRNVVKLARAGRIDDTDVAITSLRTHIDELGKREQALSAQILQHEQTARDKLKVNRKAAKIALQKKQLVEKSYDRTLALLDQLETVMQKIDDASDNKQALAALHSSSAVLHQLNQATDVEAVDDVVEQLQDAAAHTDEVTSSLADLSLDNADKQLEDMDLDTELEQMEEEERAKGLKLPDVPTHKIGENSKIEKTHKVGKNPKVGETRKVGKTTKVGETRKVGETPQVGETPKVGQPSAPEQERREEISNQGEEIEA